jgi:MFS family permease
VVIPIALIVYATGLFLLSRVETDSSYLLILLPGTLLFGLGLTGSGIPITIAAVSGVPHSQAGLASGLISTTQQIGISIGLAVISTIAASVTANYTGLVPAKEGMVRGYQAGFLTAAGFALAGVILALVLLREKKTTTEPVIAGEFEEISR